MTRFAVHQFENHDLIQITNGRSPHSPEYPDGWEYRHEVDDTKEAIGTVAAIAPSQVLDAVSSNGWCQLHRIEIQENWKARWVK